MMDEVGREKAEILLIKPNIASLIAQPLGLMYIAGMLRKEGCRVQIIDMKGERNIEEVLKKLKVCNPNFVGISFLYSESDVVLKITEGIKKLDKNVVVVAGGPYPSSAPQVVLKDKNIDFVCIGEGEYTFPELVRCIKKGGDISKIKGIAYRDNHSIKVNERRPFIENLDELPFPAWDLIDISSYSRFPSIGGMGGMYAALFTSRGCPFKCIYCHNLFGKRFRGRSPENVVSEIEMLNKKYGVKNFEVYDDIFNFDIQRAERICDLIISKGLRINLAFPNGLRVELLSYQLLTKLKKAGTRKINIAIETATPRLQRFVKRNLDIKKAEKIIEEARSLGMFTSGAFMLGFPTETREEILQTIKFATKSKLHTATFFMVTPNYGTELYEMVKKKEGVEEIDLEQLDFLAGSFNLSNIPSKELVLLQRIAYLKFYLNPLRIIRILPHVSVKLSLLKAFQIIKYVFFKKRYRVS